MEFVLELVVAVLLIVGSGFALVGAIGLARLPDFFTRLHGPTKASTMGVGSIVLASIVFFVDQGKGFSLSELLLMVFIVMTAPVSANLLAKAAMHLQVRTTDDTRGNTWDQ
ncbi:Na+/H+ antiporter subunit G [Marinobacter salicampi]|uniref:Na+/H+ antiporter subunit G n=1 Tax=Marinobacter salicampi TaxID=435907 RepID=UPI00140B68D8|nr:Na+/H+ antiporter subunit G [Marinobacter salicampi]